MAVGKNILANITGRIWTMISIYIFVPLYISLLGVESYGVISFYTLLLTLLTFADAGLTATLNREFAKGDTNDIAYRQNLLRTFEYIYIAIGVFIVGLIFISAPFIVEKFIKSDSIPYSNLVKYVRIMGVVIAFYLFSSLYNGGLMGLQKQVLRNALQIFYGILRSGLVLIPLFWIRDLGFYFYWQLFSVIIYFFVLRHFVNNIVSVPKPVIPSFSYFSKIWKYALGMMAMAIIYAVNTQIDKLSISKLLSLTDFSHYSLAAMVGQGVLVLAMPIGMAFFPELTRLVALKDVDRSKQFYHKFSYIIAAITSSLTIIILLYANDYILIWTGNVTIAQSIVPTTILLTLGAMFMSVQLCPYYLALANAHTRTNVALGIFSILVIIPSLQFLIPKYGLLGAAIPWLIINFIATVLLGYIVMSKFMKGEFLRWFILDSILPILVSFSIGVLLSFLLKYCPEGIYYSVIYGLMIVFITVLANGYIFSRIYPEILHTPIVTQFLKKKK